MATSKSSTLGFELTSLFDQAAGQFRNLNVNEPGQWPTLPKLALWVFMVAAVVVAGWFSLLNASQEELDNARAEEPKLKVTYRGKLAQAVNLAELRKQKLQMQEYVTQLEKQLPGKAEMDALLSDINQAGLGRGLLFELFRPGTAQVKDFYVEQPISVRVTGRYHDLGAFTADVANLSRIVTLHNLNILPARDGTLAMDAIARTYRYLDAAEVAEQRKASQAAAKPGAPKP
ncbi:MAG: type 4a pilus biogenesis protein PilO [Rubrivivax sp.]|nr:type 4a pilus biogenesis protein PilO [Rubrivivax sp.]